MTPENLSLFTTLTLVFAAAIAGGYSAGRLKLPTLVGYIAAGIMVGNILPTAINRPFLSLIADTGITILLFTVGIEFSFQRLNTILRTVSWAAVLQIVLTAGMCFLVLTFLQFSFLPALFIASAAALSSTAVVVKILSEHGELDTVPGEVATGWLVVQDIAVIPLMVLLPAVSGVVLSGKTDALAILIAIGGSIVKTLLFLFLIFAVGKRGIPKFLSTVAKWKSQELFILTTVGCIFLATVLAYLLGLSAPLGAFIAGLLIAETSQNHAVFAEIRPLRDLFAVVFFVALGLALPLPLLFPFLPVVLVMTVAVMAIKWVLVMGLARYLGYHRKTSFLVALSLTQMSEFGFVLAAVGVSLSALTTGNYTFLIALTFLTILISTPFIARGHDVYYHLYRLLERRLPKLFPVHTESVQGRHDYPLKDHVVICGYGRVGKYIGRAFEMAGIPFLVVDYNHATLAELRARGIPVVYGDPADRDVLDYAEVEYAKALVIAIPDRHTQEMIIAHAQTLKRGIKIVCRTHHEEDQRHLKSLGVQVVIQPEFEAAVSIVTRLLSDFGVAPDEVSGKVARLKIEHGLG
ncbi:cation:proton antiporter [Patescibacteria group bacterium]|nr:cation:proton antiporter [Patescibacteria group bacterium]